MLQVALHSCHLFANLEVEIIAMPRPTSKPELLHLADANYRKLLKLISDQSAELQEKEFPPGTMNRHISDVICHLHEWHKMLMDWYQIGMTGNKPEMPAKGYTWKDTSILNHRIWEYYKDTNLEQALKWFNESHKEVYSLIEKHSDKELFEKKRYPWTGTTSLGAYFISATSSHYDWAYKLIRKSLKPLKAKP